MNLKPISVLTGVPLALVGCGMLPKPVDLAVPGEPQRLAAVERFDLGEVFSFASEVDAATVSTWQELLRDDVLAALISEAFANNPSLQASAEAVMRAEAILRQAQSARSPLVGFNTGLGAATDLEGNNSDITVNGRLTASWEADLWGRIRADIKAADFDLLSSRALFEQARQALAAAIARTYLRAIEADAQVALSLETVDALRETLRIVQIRYDEGFAPRRELVLAEADLASAEDAAVELAAIARAERRLLNTLIGRYPDDDIILSTALPVDVAAPMPGARAELLRRRPDILAAEFDLRAAFADVAVVEAGRWPSLTVDGIFSANGDIADILDPASLAISLGATLANPLFDGGLTQGRLDAASATARLTVANYGDVVLQALAEVETALDDISTLDRRRELVARTARASRETLELSEVQYREGDIDLLDVLTFRQRSLTADRNVVRLQRLALEARIALFLALGGEVPVAELPEEREPDQPNAP